MKKYFLTVIISLLIFDQITAQELCSINGVVQSTSQTPLKGVSIKISGAEFQTQTNDNGIFRLEKIPLGAYVIEVYLSGFEAQKIPIHLREEKDLNLGTVILQLFIPELQESSIILLSDDDLLDDGERSSDNIAGLFQSSKDAYLRAAAFNYSQSWFKVRGYDSSYGIISINGIEMNKLYDGRPQWGNWGGLNDVFRNQESSNGIAASDFSFGNILGATNFTTRASDYQAGGKVSLAATNKSYTGRVMANYATGLNKNGWAFAVSASRRVAQEGYLDGTTYNAWAAFLAIEKKINTNNSINLTAFTSPNRRGKSSPNTQEVYDLKGYTYNAYWGYQEGDKRNSRIKEVVEPVVMLTHIYEKENTTLKTTAAFQFGHIGNSRLGYFNAPNPDPTYWKNLPSSYLRYSDDLDYANAYLSEQDFINNGQINWNEIYLLNANKSNALYYLYEDRVDDTQISLSSVLNTSLNDHINLSGGVSFNKLTSNNYGKMLDLLGSDGFEDLDQYAIGDAQQNDLNNPNRVVGVGDKFQYNYTINGSVASAFAQIRATQRKVDYFAGINFKSTSFQRNGLYKNGTYNTNSFGKGEKQSFTDVSAKGGLTYKITGRHLVTLNGGYISNAPNIKTTFSNSRVNNNITPDLTSEKILTGDVSYIFRSPKIQSRVTTYYTKFSNAIETSFFFAEGLLGDQADFVNEITTGVDKLNIGAELSIEYQVTSTIKLLGAGSFGQFTYNNNPHIYIQSESLINEDSDFGTTYLKNYKVSGTPQRAYSLAFEYRDPAYWWFQINGSLLSNNYLDISPLLRTDNFYIDADGVPFLDDETGLPVTQEQVDDLLVQEKFDDAFLLDAVGGKSWRVNNKYIGFFVGINNILGELYKTGGFEQSRKSNYPELKEDKQLNKPIFGPKYWYGNKTSYYLNLYVRF
ncbi:TonB-dependent receptor domain-containing protein [Lutibacter sp.]|uniref:TonB-dependent receptor domain-containing protein n=1 Tax=Lutibacter sp. TaxID=1925666 RepID=UPI00356B54F1